MNAKFNLPDFIQADRPVSIYSNLKAEAPYIFLPNSEIASVFGIFPGAIWNGGGMSFGGQKIWTREEMKSIIEYYNFELHIPLRFTFTNPLLAQEHVYDTFCNVIAECGHNGYNEILVVSPILEAYLRERYPNYKYCRSIIGTREIPCDLSDKYDLTVMRRIKNNDWEFLEQIPQEKRHKVEFLCTDPCPDNCPRLYTHYRDFARGTLEFSTSDESQRCNMFEVKGRFKHHYTTGLKTYISREMIDNEYLPRGFNQFKISGRGSFIGAMNGIVEYMIKPEYRQDVRDEIISAGFR